MFDAIDFYKLAFNFLKDALWENAAPGEVHERIRHHLIQNKFGQAISLLEEAKETFPVFKNLDAIADNQENISAQLRTIYFMPLFREMARVEENEKEDENNAELEQQKFLVNYYKDSLNFATALNEALPIICLLLGSKQIRNGLSLRQIKTSLKTYFLKKYGHLKNRLRL